MVGDPSPSGRVRETHGRNVSPATPSSGERTPRGPYRLLVISPRRWTRALLIAQLAEVGYDAVGASSVLAALRYPSDDPERGPIGAILLEDRALDPEGRALLQELRDKHPAAQCILVTRASGIPPAGPWDLVIRRPVSVGEIVARLSARLPR